MTAEVSEGIASSMRKVRNESTGSEVVKWMFKAVQQDAMFKDGVALLAKRAQH